MEDLKISVLHSYPDCANLERDPRAQQRNSSKHLETHLSEAASEMRAPAMMQHPSALISDCMVQKDDEVPNNSHSDGFIELKSLPLELLSFF